MEEMEMCIKAMDSLCASHIAHKSGWTSLSRSEVTQRFSWDGSHLEAQFSFVFNDWPVETKEATR
jgi:hypothetical protein